VSRDAGSIPAASTRTPFAKDRRRRFLWSYEIYLLANFAPHLVKTGKGSDNKAVILLEPFAFGSRFARRDVRAMQRCVSQFIEPGQGGFFDGGFVEMVSLVISSASNFKG